MDAPAPIPAVSGAVSPACSAAWRASPLTKSDVEAVVRLHQRCFPDYFLTQLGPWFLRRFYAEFLFHPLSYGVVLRSTGNELIGFVVGTSDSSAHFCNFYRRNAVRAIPLIAGKLLTRSEVRRMIGARLGHVWFAVRSMLPGGKRTAPAPTGPAEQCAVRLLSIAIAPEQRGTGAAQAITEYFESVLRQAGHRRYGLSVRPTNGRAIRFYRRTGWQLTCQSPAGLWFEKDL
jgi:ribosomal protein S18 acetylase RimI-like enzyme